MYADTDMVVHAYKPSTWGDSGKKFEVIPGHPSQPSKVLPFSPQKKQKNKKQVYVCGMGGYRSHFFKRGNKNDHKEYEKCPPSLFRNTNNTMGFHLILIKMATTQNKNIIIKNHSKQKVTMLVKSRKIVTLCTVSENIK